MINRDLQHYWTMCQQYRHGGQASAANYFHVRSAQAESVLEKKALTLVIVRRKIIININRKT